ETDEHAEELAISQDAWLLHVEKGLDSRVPSIEEAKTANRNKEELTQIRNNRKRMIIGGPDKVNKELRYLSDQYQCDDWLILTNIYDFQEKKQSYRRLMELFS